MTSNQRNTNLAARLPLALQAILSALPDAVSSSIWISPFLFGIGSVKTTLSSMLPEPFLVHTTGFYTGFGASRDRTGNHLWVALTGLTSFYVLMIGAIAWTFDTWWLLLAFGCPFAGKISWILKKPSDDQTMQAMAALAGLVVAYLFACFFTLFVDLPYLGFKPELVATIGLDPKSEGLWQSEPHRVVAFGVLYFAILALAKLSGPFAAIAWKKCSATRNS